MSRGESVVATCCSRIWRNAPEPKGRGWERAPASERTFRIRVGLGLRTKP